MKILTATKEKEKRKAMLAVMTRRNIYVVASYICPYFALLHHTPRSNTSIEKTVRNITVESD